MVAYLGSPGNLIRVHDPADQSKDSQRPARYMSTIGGTTFAQVGPRTKRTWDVRLPRISTPAEVATWQAFVEGEFGNGPWWFVPEMAASTNLLSPRGSLLDTRIPQDGVTDGGRMVLPDGGVAGRSAVVEFGNRFFPWVDSYEFVPVIPGLPVTGSVWVDGPVGVRMRIRFYNADGEPLRTYGDAHKQSSEVERLHLSDVAQEGEFLVLVLVDHPDQVFRVARPAISWTADAVPWSVGAGAPKVHIAGMSEDVTLAVPGREMVGASLTVREVG